MIRCVACKRFTKSNRCDVRMCIGGEHITNQRGDCARCGPSVPVESDGWEDWFGERPSVLEPDLC